MNIAERKSLENLIEDEEGGGDSMIVAEKKSLEDLMEDDEGDMNVAERKSLEDLMEDEEGDMNVAERESLEDLIEDEEDIAMNVDADFSVQLAAMFEPCRSSRIPPIKTSLVMGWSHHQKLPRARRRRPQGRFSFM